jgi:hypothetical protein
MNRSVLRRKMVYLAILVAMLLPLYLMGQPSSGPNDPGGQLSAMRLKYEIAESQLGDISPSSETMKLASLGLRGVAATMLWSKANNYQIEHEWDRHRATVNNLTLLQPHFPKVWEYQAHNLTYNVSKEFDDYRQRYEMVREGSEFLIQGVRQNRKATRLIWFTGWFYGSKIGMADEKRQFRRLFADDEIAHQRLQDQGIQVDSPEALGPNGKPDNWLVGRLWLRYGYDLVDSGVEIKGQFPLNFFETGPKGRLKHAEAIESEGVLDEGAVTAWQLAHKDWVEFGNRSMPTTARFTIKLDQLEEMKRERSEKIQAFRDLVPDLYDQSRQKLVSELDERFTKLYQADPKTLVSMERGLRENLITGLEPDRTALLPSVASTSRLKGIELIDGIKDLDERIQKTVGYCNQTNYAYWKQLAEAEQEERTVKARRLIFDAEKAYEKANLDEAIKLYEEAFGIWATIYKDYPILTTDESAESVFRSIRRYMVAIDSEDFPDGFPLLLFAEMMAEGQGENALPPGAYEDMLLIDAQAAEEKLESDAKVNESDAASKDKSASEEAAKDEPAKADDASAEPAKADDASAEPAKADDATEESSTTDDAKEKSSKVDDAKPESSKDASAEKDPAETDAAEDDSSKADTAEDDSADDKPLQNKSAEPTPEK